MFHRETKLLRQVFQRYKERLHGSGLL